MHRKLILIVLALALVAGFAVAQDLTIDYQYNMRRADPANFLTFAGPIRYMAVDADTVDAASGASMKMSTELFQPYRVDVLGKNVMPSGLRGLLLYAVNTPQAREDDNLMVTRANTGVITIEYVHRGTAYRLVTDRNGVLSLPAANSSTRRIGYIQGAGPQVISRDFSRNGTAGRVDYAKVWDSGVASGTVVADGNDTVTGSIGPDVAVADSMFFWQGDLQVTLASNILRISGGLNAIAR
jgi:hypothetical protein